MSKGINEIISGEQDTRDKLVEESLAPIAGKCMTTYVNIDSIQTRLTGNYNLSNVLAAVTVGNYFNKPG
jgi:UDP-N-acetylmuramyl tripeptide synthase